MLLFMWRKFESAAWIIISNTCTHTLLLYCYFLSKCVKGEGIRFHTKKYEHLSFPNKINMKKED